MYGPPHSLSPLLATDPRNFDVASHRFTEYKRLTLFSRPRIDLSGPLTSLFATHPQNALVTPLFATHFPKKLCLPSRSSDSSPGATSDRPAESHQSQLTLFSLFPHSFSAKSFICHSYENTRGVGGVPVQVTSQESRFSYTIPLLQIPIWNDHAQ